MVNKKSLTKNYFYNLIYQIIAVLTPLITAPYISRIIMPDGIGAYSYTASICSYFVLFSILGTDTYGQREIAYCGDNMQKRSKTFFEIYFLRVFGILIVSIIYVITSLMFSGINRILLLIQLIDLLGSLFNIVFFMQGVEEFKSLLVRNLILKVLSVFFIFIVVKTNDDLYLYVALTSIAVVLGNVSLWFNAKKYLCYIPIKQLKIFPHLLPSIALFLPTIALRLYDAFDKTMIGAITHNASENGYYEQSLKIITISISIVTSLGNVVLPRIASLFSTNEMKKIEVYIYKSFDIVWFFSLPIACGIFAISDNMVPWFFGEYYCKVITLLKLFSIICIPMGIKNIIGVQYLIPTKKHSVYTKSIIIGLIFNVVLNTIFISKWESVGAVIASVLSEFLIVIYQFSKVYKVFSIKKIFESTPKKMLSALVMLFIISILSHKLRPSIINTMGLIFMGSCIYALILLCLKDNTMIFVLKSVKKFI